VKDSHIIYERIADITSLMLVAVRAKDWQKIAELEALCAIETKKITSTTPEPLTGAALDRKIASIHKILAHDREIRDLLNPWMLKMDALLSGKTTKVSSKIKSPGLDKPPSQ
jgi:flagellar protein FliT